MSLHSASADVVCNALLDQDLSAAERWSVERRMDYDVRLAETVQLQERVDASVRRSFATPDLDAMLARVEAAVAAAPAPPRLVLVRPSVDAQPERQKVSAARLFLQGAAALLICCLALWFSSDDSTVRVGNPELSRAVEAKLTEAMALGVAGAAALAGSRRLLRGRRGRFVLDRFGMRLTLPEGVSEAIEMHAAASGCTLVYRGRSGERAVVVLDAANATEAIAPAGLRRRLVGDVVLVGSSESEAPLLEEFAAVPAVR